MKNYLPSGKLGNHGKYQRLRRARDKKRRPRGLAGFERLEDRRVLAGVLTEPLAGELQLDGSPGENYDLELRIDTHAAAPHFFIEDVGGEDIDAGTVASAVQIDPSTVAVPLPGLTRLNVNFDDGNDTLTLVNDPLLPNNIDVIGGTGTNNLVIKNNPASGDTFTLNSQQIVGHASLDFDDSFGALTMDLTTGGLHQVNVNEGFGGSVDAIAINGDGDDLLNMALTSAAPKVITLSGTTARWDNPTVVEAPLSTMQVLVDDVAVAGHHPTAVLQDGIDDLTSISRSPDGNFLYGVSPSEKALVILQINQTTGGLTHFQTLKDVSSPVAGGTVSNGLGDPNVVAVSPDNRYIYVGNWGSPSTVAVFERNLGTGIVTFRNEVTDDTAVNGIARPSSFAFGTSNGRRYVYVAGADDDAIVVFRQFGSFLFDRQVVVNDPAVIPNDLEIDGLDEPVELVTSPDGRFLYAASKADNAILTFFRSPTTGELTLVQTVQNVPFGDPRFIFGATNMPGLDGVQALAISPDGDQLYAGSQNDTMLVLMRRNQLSGQLAQLGAPETTSLTNITELAISPTGTGVYVGSDADGLETFRRHVTLGTLTSAQLLTHADTENFRSLTVSNDSRFIYGAATLDDAINVFAAPELRIPIAHTGLAHVSVSTGVGQDAFHVFPDPATGFSVNASSPTIVPGDKLHYYGPGQVTETAPRNGFIDSLGNERVNYVSIEDVLPDALALTVSSSSISENGGANAAQLTIRRTLATEAYAAPLLVTLTNDDTTEASIVTTVTIPGGQQEITIPIDAIDDDLLDGTQTVNFTATAAGMADGAASINVLDHEFLTLVADVDTLSENGGVTFGTLTRSNTDDLGAPLSVLIVNSDTSELNAPASVTIPGGQASTTFPINAVDDTTLDGTQIVTLTAQQTGYINGAQTMFVQDHETLTISIVPDNFAENDGGAVATATVTRSNVSDLDAHVISITNGDDSEVAVPLTVVIPENQFSTTFDVNAVDDTTLDGTQTVSITASSVGFISGSDSVTVDDHETLEVTISRPAVSESDGAGAANVTIRRSNITDLSQPLVVTLVNSAPDEISIPASLTLAVGDSVGSFLLNAVDDFILDGTQIASITAQATGFVDGASSVDVLDHEILVVSLDDLEVDEDAGPAATQGTVSRSNTGNLASPLTVTITSSDTTEAQPAVAIVTIPANETDGAFTIDAIDDALLDGTQTVMIDAISPGFFSQPASLDVVDAEQLTLSIDMTSIAENAGPNAAVGTLTRSDVDTNVAVSVTLLHDDPSEVDTQTVFTIPGDQSSIQFPIHAVDDDLLDGTQTVNFAVSSFGFLGDAATLDVTDFETLSVVIDEDSIGENGGTSSATVTRSNTDNAAPLLVTIGDDDPSELSHPATVTIPANEASAAFTLTGVDDALLDGTQTVTVTGSASGYEVVSDTIDVTDHETLTLTLADSAISENGGVTTATVTRSNTDIASPLLVSIVNPDATEISTASTVTIPATELSADFTVNAVDDTIFDGTVPVTLTVDALGYAPGQATIDVTDHELLTLTIADASISENGGSTTATVKRHNTDIGLPLTVFLNANPSDEVSIPATIEIPALQDEFTFDIDAFDDDVLDGDIGVEIRASAASYVDGVDNVVVTDFERLTVSALQTSTTENAGANALTLTVSRFNNDIVGDLIVTLRSDDTTEATTPASVKIPDGQQSATFTIDAVDDSLLDGVQKVPIVASGGAYGDGTLIISVWDFESLIVDVAATSILESDGPQATVATVSRSNTDVSSDLTISLFNNDPSEATTPLIVVIPAGRQSITFDVGAVQDSIDDGTQTVRLDAAQIDYQPGMDTFDVVDVTDVPNKWTNPANPFDVDNRNGVTIADLLVLVDAFNSRGPGPLPAPNGPDVPPPFVDVNCDLKLSASDLLVLATHLNDLLNGGGEGEGEGLGALHTTQQLVGIPASSLDSAPLENRLRQSQSSSRQSDNTVDLLFATGGDDSTTGARSFLRGEASDDDSLDQVIGDIADDVANDWLS